MKTDRWDYDLDGDTMKYYIIRHGQTSANKEWIIQGHLNASLDHGRTSQMVEKRCGGQKDAVHSDLTGLKTLLEIAKVTIGAHTDTP